MHTRRYPNDRVCQHSTCQYHRGCDGGDTSCIFPSGWDLGGRQTDEQQLDHYRQGSRRAAGACVTRFSLRPCDRRRLGPSGAFGSEPAGLRAVFFVPVNSIVPRRYRCQPDLAVAEAITAADKPKGSLSAAKKIAITSGVQARIRPAFASLRYGRPDYCQLGSFAPKEIRIGADDESEMGSFHDLFAPQRENNLKIRLEEYLRFGLEAGIFYST